MAVRRGKKRTVTVDMSGVESGGKAVPDGVYDVEVVEVTEEESSEGNPYLKWKFRITDGDAKGAALYDNTSLQPQALWRLKGLLEVLGVEVPDSTMELSLEDYVGESMAVTVVNEEYQGKDRPKIAQYGGEAKPVKAKVASRKKSAKDEEQEEEVEEFKKGDRVKFEDDGKAHKGKVIKIDGDTITVETSDGEEWDIDVSDLTKL